MIGDLLPPRDTEVRLRLRRRVRRVTLEPQRTEPAVTGEGEELVLSVAEFRCHQMVVLHG